LTSVALALVRELARAVQAPRPLYLHWPFGHALGEPGNRLHQLTILHDAFSMAESAPRPGLVIDLPYQWWRQQYAPIVDWSMESKAFKRAMAQTRASEETSGL